MKAILCRWVRAVAMGVAVCGCWSQAALGQDITGTLNTAWESFWQQSGYPQPLFKWQTALRVRFGGVTPERHKAVALRHLQTVAEQAGLAVMEVAAEDDTANVHIDFFGAEAPLPGNQPCVTNLTLRNGAIVSGTIRANGDTVWRCMLHESMHLMGFPGHPLYHSVLTYFARGSQLTRVDKLLLKTLYSPEVASGTSPFALLEMLARHLVDNAGDAEPAALKRAADAFLIKTVQAMEAFGNGTGEAPTVIARSGKATKQGIERGQVEIQYFLGLAYRRGHIVTTDKDKALRWFNKAAAAAHNGAAAQLKLAVASDKH